MENQIKIYSFNKSNMLAGIFILTILFLGLTLPAIISGEKYSQIIDQQGFFWLIGIIITILPLGSRFEVGKDYTKTYLFGIRVDTLRASDIESVKYGKVRRWGVVGMGNGLMGWKKTSHGRTYFSFSEAGFGKEAILDAKRALETK